TCGWRGLRHVLGDGAKRPPIIRTVYGFGYAFSGEARDVPDAHAPAPPPAPSRVTRFRLFLDDREIALREGENLLGRLDEGIAWFESPTVSRRHARIVVEGSKAV